MRDERTSIDLGRPVARVGRSMPTGIINDVLVAAGLSAVSMSQLRVVGGVLGPGELLLVSYIAVSVMRALLALKIYTSKLTIVTYTLLLGIIAFCISFIFANNRVQNYHDIQALGLGLMICISYSLLNNHNNRFVMDTFSVLISIVCLTCLLLPSEVAAELGIELYEDGRLQAASENPNQFALFLCPTPFIIAGSRKNWYYKVATVVPILLAGFVTLSDALVIAWLIGLSMFVAHAYYIKLPGSSLVSKVTGVAMVLLPLFLISFMWLFYSEIMSTVDLYGTKTYESQSRQGATRVELWKNGLQAFYASPLYGWGGGGQSGMGGPFRGEEAHNTLIDWVAATGLIGGVSFVAMMVFVVYSCIRSRHSFAFGLIVSMLTFSVFHYTLRNPIFWISSMWAIACTSKK